MAAQEGAKSRLTVQEHPETYAYLKELSLRLSPAQRELLEVIQRHPEARMSSAPDEAQFLALLASILNARTVVEVGVFLGYTTLTLAEALPPGGRVYALDVSEEFTGIARQHWGKAGVGSKIDLRIAPAVETLDQLLAAGLEGTVDLAFIDADKCNYGAYFERCLRLVRKGGVIAVDNVLWGGKVLDPAATDADTLAIRELNKKLHADQRVSISILPVADGVTLCYKR